MPLRIGAVSYLNTKPLIYRWTARFDDINLTLDLPSRLADQLADRRLDVALIPSVEYLRGGDQWRIVSDACIACRGPVRSVQLLFRCHPSQVKTLALDEGSRTSAALSQVLLYECHGVRPHIVPLAMEDDYEASPADAVLIIGDRAMQVDASKYTETWDLGEKWRSYAGLPFVFALWVANVEQGSELSDEDFRLLAINLEATRDEGLAAAGSIAAREAPSYGLTQSDCERYFTEQLHFHLGSDELAGLELFQTLTTQLGLIPERAIR